MSFSHWLERLKAGIRTGNRRRWRAFSSGLRRQFRTQAPRFEALEDRALLTTAVTLTSGVLTITDVAGGDTNDLLQISHAAGTYTITDTGGATLNTAIAGSTGDGTSTVTVPDTGVTGMLFDTLGGDDAVTISSVQPSFSGNFTIAGGTGSDTATINGAINTTGTGAINITVGSNITLGSGSSLTTVDGGITLSANASGTGVGNFVGIDLDDADITTTGSGNISLSGSGGDDAGTGSHYGVHLQFGSTVSSSGTGMNAGTIIGSGGNGTSNNLGILHAAGAGFVRSVDGDIMMSGSGGSGSGSFNEGIVINSSTVTSTGTTADAANISILGTGGAGSVTSQGVSIASSLAQITTVAGDLTVTGTGGTGGAGNTGVALDAGAQLQVATGILSVTGTAGGGASDGLWLAGFGPKLRSVGAGSIILTGTAFGSGSDIALDGLSNTTLIGGPSASGAITINANSIDSSGAGAKSIQGTGTLTIQPRTAGTTIGLGGGNGTLNLDDTELGFIQNGFSSITIGSATSGDIDVKTATFSDPLTLITGGEIHDAAAGTDLTLGSGDAVTIDGTLAPGQSPGIAVIDGDVNFADGSVFKVEVGGTSPGTASTNHDQLSVANGSVTIGTGVALNPLDFNSFGSSVVPGHSFTIIDIAGAAETVTGTFMDLAEGAAISNFLGSGMSASITYAGGDGNDVVLTVQPPPTFSKAFSPDAIIVNQVSTLTFTIDNSASTLAATGLDFTDNLPTGLVIATPPNASTTATGGSLTATAGTGTISYTGGSVTGGAAVTVTVDVIATASGVFVNTSGDLTSSLGNSGIAADTLTVNPPDTGVTLSSGTLTITDADGADSNDDLTISYSSGTYTITDNGGLLLDASSIAGSTGTGTSTVTVPDTSVTGILFDVLGGDDSITVDSVQPILSGGFTITGGTGDDKATINGDIAATGAGAVTITVSQNITVSSGASITTVNGDISLSANAAGTTTGNFIGIEINAATIQATGTGNVTIQGTGGDASSNTQIGVLVEGGSSIVSASGTINIDGKGGGSGSGNRNFGVHLHGTGSNITTTGGSVSVTGMAGDTTGSDNKGVLIDALTSIDVGGSGNFELNGTGGTGLSQNAGVEILAESSTSLAGGNLTIHGTGGGGATGSLSRGVFIGAPLTVGGNGTVSITGTGGAGPGGNNQGVLLETSTLAVNSSDGLIQSDNGSIMITGADGGGSGSDGVRLANSHSTIASTGGGDITITTDTINLSGTSASLSSTGSLTIRPRTASTTIGLGEGSGTLNLDDTELATLQDGFHSITIGDVMNGTGVVDIDSSTFSDNVTIAGGSIAVTGLDAGSNTVTLTALTGFISDGGDAGIDVTGGAVILTSAGTIGASGDGLSLAAMSLTTDSTATDGGQFLSEADSVSVTSLDAGNGTVTISGGTFNLGSGTAIGDSTAVDVQTGATLNVNGQTETLTLVTISGGSLIGTGTLNAPVTATSGSVAPGTSPGIIATADLLLGAGSIFDIELNSPYTTAGTDYDQLDVTGAVTLGAMLNFTGGAVAPSGGESIIISSNDGSDAVSGMFDGWVEGDAVTVGSFSGTLTNQGGDGNDIALVVTGPYSIDGTSGDDDFEVRRVNSSGVDLLQVLRGGVVVDSRPTSTVTMITINGDDGDDTLTVNYFGSGGFFTTPVTFNGNGQTTGDDIVILGGSVDSVTHQFDNDNDGEFTVDLGGQSQTTTYTGLEPVLDHLSATDRVFTFTGGAETITLSDDAGPDDGISLIDSTLGESVTFVHPTGSLTINAGSGADTINLTGLDSTFDTALTINGDGTGSGGSALININGNVDTGAGAVMIGSDGNVSTVDFTGGSLTTTANVSIATTGAISDGDVTVDVSAAGLLLSAGETIGSIDALDTAITSLEVVTSGSLHLIETDNLTIGGVDVGTNGISSTGAIVITLGGVLTVNEDITTDAGNSGDLRITGAVTVSTAATVSAFEDSITLTANDDGDDDAVIAGTATADDHNEIRASRDVLISGLVQTLGPDGDITIRSDFDSDGIGGTRVTTSGQLVSADRTDIAGSALSDVVADPIAVEIEDDGTSLQINSVDTVRIFPVAGMLGDASIVIDGAIQGSAANANIFISSNGDVLLGDNGDLSIPSALAGVGFLGVFADNNSNGSGGITMSDDTHLNAGASDVELLASEDITLGGVEAGRDIELETAGAVRDGGNSLIDLIAGRRLQIDAGTGVGTAADQLETTVAQLTVDTDNGDIQITNSTAMSIEAFFVPDGPGRLFPGLFIRDDSDLDPAGEINVTTNGGLTLNGSVINEAAGDITLTASDSAATGEHLTVNEQEIDPMVITPADITSNGGMITLNVGDDFSVTNPQSTISTTGDILVHLDSGDADSGVGSTATFDGNWTSSSLTIDGQADADTIDASAIDIGAVINGGNGNDTITGTSGNDTITGQSGDDSLNGNAGDDLFRWIVGDGSDNIDGSDDSDTIELVSGIATDVDYTFVSESDGSIDIDAWTITYTGFEPVIDNLDAANRSFNYTGGTETITLSDDGTAGDGISMIDSTLGEVVMFVYPTVSLTINAGDGNDTIDLQGLDSTFAGAITVNGGADSDSVSVTGNTNANGGTISIGEAGDVEVISFDGGALITTGNVNLFSIGSIADNDALTDVSANNAALGSGTGIGNFANSLDTTVTTLEADGGTGGVSISNTGDLTIDDIHATLTGVTATGDIELTSDARILSFETVASNGGNLRLTATDDIEIGGGGQVQSTGGNVDLRGGDNILIASGATVDAAGTVTIDGDFGDADPGIGTTIEIFGTINTGSRGIIRGQADNDVITLAPGSTTGSLLIDGQDGDDQYNIQLGNLGGQVDIDDQATEGSDTLSVSGTTGDDTVSVDASRITANTTQVITYTDTLETINIDGSDGADAFVVTPSPTARINILGSNPAMIPGDSLTYNAPAGSTVTITPSGPDSGTVSATGTFLDVIYNLLEQVSIDGAAGATALHINGTSEDDLFDVDFSGSDSGTLDLTFDTDGAPGPTTTASVGFANIQTVQINAGDGDDVLQVTDPANGVSGSLNFNGQGDSDSIVLISGTATTLTHNFDNATDGSIDTDGAIINYTGLEPIADNIDATNRVFTFAGTNDDITLSDLGGGMSRIESASSSETVDFTNPTMSLTINGGDGNDTIDASASAVPVILNGGENRDHLTGSAFNDQLHGDDPTNPGFGSNDTLIGGAGDDTLTGGFGGDMYLWNDADGSDSIIGDIGLDLLEVNASVSQGDDIAVLPDGTGFTVLRTNLVPFTITVNLGISVHLNTLGGDDTITIGDLSGVFNFESRSFELDGGTGNDTIDVQALTGGPEAFIQGDDGDDIVIASTGPLGNDGMADSINIGLSALPTRRLGYSVNGTTVFRRAEGAGTDTIIVNGSGDDDSLTIDYVNGSPVARGPVFFNGGGQQAGGDTLSLIDGTVTSVTHNFTNASDGTIEIEDGDTETITYTGLEPIFDNLSATDRIFNFGATDDEITLSDLGGGLSRIESVSSSETVDFVNPATSLTVNANDGADTINYDSLATAAAVTLNAGDGTDIVNVLGATAGSSTTVNGGLASDTINIGSAGNSLDSILGDVTINGDDHDAAPTVTLGTNILPQGDVLNINDQGHVSAVTYAITAVSIVRTLSGTITYAAFESLTINAGSGVDTFNVATTAASVNTTLNGGDGADIVSLVTTGDSSSVVINGEDSHDTISFAASGAGSVTLISGGNDNDTITGSGSGHHVTILGGAGNDSLTGGSGDDSISGGDDTDVIRGGLGADTLSGGNNDDVFVWDDGDGNDLVEGDDGTDRQIVNAADNPAEGDNIAISDHGARIGITRAAGTMLGTFILDVSTTEIIEVNSFAGDDTIDASGLTNGRMNVNAGDGVDTVTGGSQNDTLSGNGGADSIDGSDGDDTIRGGAGADTLNGQAGSDLVEGQGSSGDRLTGETGSDTLDGGMGTDTIIETADQDFDLGESSLIGMITGSDTLIDIEQALLTGGASANVIDAADFNGSATLLGLAGADTITGGAIVDLIYGGDGNDVISGQGGGDIIHGQGGNDSILGGEGNDTIRGSAGRDTLRGDAGDDQIFGQGSSGDILQGGTGNDTLDGGAGNDRVFESADTDFVLIDGQLTGGTTGVDVLIDVENVQLIGGASANTIDASGFTGFATLSGAAGDDSIIAAAGGSIVNGDAGADSLFGSQVADTINGGTGDDTINAQAGNDSVNGGDNNDLINGSLGADTIDGGAGDDRILGSTNVDYLADPIQPLDLATENNTHNDSLLGGGGADTIVGALGSDFIDGNDGADVIDVTSGGDGLDGIDTVMGDMLDAIFADPTDLLI